MTTDPAPVTDEQIAELEARVKQRHIDYLNRHAGALWGHDRDLAKAVPALCAKVKEQAAEIEMLRAALRALVKPEGFENWQDYLDAIDAGDTALQIARSALPEERPGLEADHIMTMTDAEVRAKAIADLGSEEAVARVARDMRAKMLATVDAHMAVQAPTPDPAVMRDYIDRLTRFFIDQPEWVALAEEARGYIGALAEDQT